MSGEPPIHAAARRGDLAALGECLAQGVDVNLSINIGNFGWSVTPLMVAAESSQGASRETLVWLIANGADPLRRCGWRVTAAWHAARARRSDKVEDSGPFDHRDRLALLLDAGCDPNEATIHGASLLCRACGAGDPERVRLLLERGASVHAVRPGADTTPGSGMDAERKKWEERLRNKHDNFRRHLEQMMRENLCDAKPTQCSSSEIPLFCAAESDSEECVRLVLAAGADIHVLDDQGRSALFMVRSVGVAKLLVDAGIDVTVTSLRGKDAVGEILYNDPDPDIDPFLVATAAHIREVCRKAGIVLNEQKWLFDAVFSRVPDVVDDLLAASISPHFCPYEDKTLVHIACFGRATHTELHCDATRRILRALFAAGVPLEAVDEKGQTALHEAVTGDGGDAVAVEVLIGLGADVNVRDLEGRTPLMAIADYGSHHSFCGPCMSALLRAGADPSLEDAQGMTALMIAADGGVLECVRLLLDAGVDPSYCNEAGLCALDLAWEHLECWRQIVGSEKTPEDRHLEALRRAEETWQLLDQAVNGHGNQPS